MSEKEENAAEAAVEDERSALDWETVQEALSAGSLVLKEWEGLGSEESDSEDDCPYAHSAAPALADRLAHLRELCKRCSAIDKERGMSGVGTMPAGLGEGLVRVHEAFLAQERGALALREAAREEAAAKEAPGATAAPDDSALPAPAQPGDSEKKPAKKEGLKITKRDVLARLQADAHYKTKGSHLLDVLANRVLEEHNGDVDAFIEVDTAELAASKAAKEATREKVPKEQKIWVPDRHPDLARVSSLSVDEHARLIALLRHRAAEGTFRKKKEDLAFYRQCEELLVPERQEFQDTLKYNWENPAGMNIPWWVSGMDYSAMGYLSEVKSYKGEQGWDKVEGAERAVEEEGWAEGLAEEAAKAPADLWLHRHQLLLSVGACGSLRLPDLQRRQALCGEPQAEQIAQFFPPLQRGNKAEVCEDANVGTLLRRYPASFALSSSVLRLLIAGRSPSHGSDWDVPVTVRNIVMGGRPTKVVYASKPLPPSKQSNGQIFASLVKYMLRSRCLTHFADGSALNSSQDSCLEDSALVYDADEVESGFGLAAKTSRPTASASKETAKTPTEPPGKEPDDDTPLVGSPSKAPRIVSSDEEDAKDEPKDDAKDEPKDAEVKEEEIKTADDPSPAMKLVPTSFKPRRGRSAARISASSSNDGLPPSGGRGRKGAKTAAPQASQSEESNISGGSGRVTRGRGRAQTKDQATPSPQARKAAGASPPPSDSDDDDRLQIQVDDDETPSSALPSFTPSSQAASFPPTAPVAASGSGPSPAARSKRKMPAKRGGAKAQAAASSDDPLALIEASQSELLAGGVGGAPKAPRKKEEVARERGTDEQWRQPQEAHRELRYVEWSLGQHRILLRAKLEGRLKAKEPTEGGLGSGAKEEPIVTLLARNEPQPNHGITTFSEAEALYHWATGFLKEAAFHQIAHVGLVRYGPSKEQRPTPTLLGLSSQPVQRERAKNAGHLPLLQPRLALLHALLGRLAKLPSGSFVLRSRDGQPLRLFRLKDSSESKADDEESVNLVAEWREDPLHGAAKEVGEAWERDWRPVLPEGLLQWHVFQKRVPATWLPADHLVRHYARKPRTPSDAPGSPAKAGRGGKGSRGGKARGGKGRGAKGGSRGGRGKKAAANKPPADDDFAGGY